MTHQLNNDELQPMETHWYFQPIDNLVDFDLPINKSKITFDFETTPIVEQLEKLLECSHPEDHQEDL